MVFMAGVEAVKDAPFLSHLVWPERSARMKQTPAPLSPHTDAAGARGHSGTLARSEASRLTWPTAPFPELQALADPWKPPVVQ